MPFSGLARSKGVDAGMIGIVLSAPIVARLLAVPVFMREADRRDAVRAALIVCGFAAAAGYTLVGLSAGAVLILVAYALTSLATTPQMPLAETYALKELAARKRADGPVRLWGSFAFIAGNFVAGFAADVIPARDLIWLIVAASVLIALAALALPPVTPRAIEPSAAASARQNLLRDRPFIAVIAAASLIQASTHDIRLLRSAVERRRFRRHLVIAALGHSRWRRDRAVRVAIQVAAVLRGDRAAATTLRRHAALDRNDLRSAGFMLACAIAARPVVRRDPSRRADVPARHRRRATAQGYLAIASGVASGRCASGAPPIVISAAPLARRWPNGDRRRLLADW
jgi:hypothetical protein